MSSINIRSYLFVLERDLLDYIEFSHWINLLVDIILISLTSKLEMFRQHIIHDSDCNFLVTWNSIFDGGCHQYRFLEEMMMY